MTSWEGTDKFCALLEDLCSSSTNISAKNSIKGVNRDNSKQIENKNIGAIPKTAVVFKSLSPSTSGWKSRRNIVEDDTKITRLRSQIDGIKSSNTFSGSNTSKQNTKYFSHKFSNLNSKENINAQYSVRDLNKSFKHNHNRLKNEDGNLKSTNQFSHVDYNSLEKLHDSKHLQKSPMEGESSFEIIKNLQELNKEEDRKIGSILSNPRNQFQNLFEEKFEPDALLLVIEILGKICKSDSSVIKSSILLSASNSMFLKQLVNFIGNLPIEENYNVKMQITSFFKNLLVFLETFLSICPSLAGERLKRVIDTTHMAIKSIEKQRLITFSKDIFDDIDNVKSTYSIIENKEIDLGRQKTSLILKPPDNFRYIRIPPTVEDMFHSAKDIFLRQNIVKGSYENIEHYLDVQFRLLREDFIAPLREGIQEYIKNPDSKHFDNIRIYPYTRFLQKIRVKSKNSYVVLFDCRNNFTNINWEYSKRFMFGSLLLFTCNGFKSFFLATVVERDNLEVSVGRIVVEILQGNELPEDLFNTEFVMAESEVYFEPYFQVLTALQRVAPHTFPMEQYIVHVNTISQMPKYMDKIVENEYIKILWHYMIDLANKNNWPSARDLGLDTSQHSAVFAALTNDFVAIQGPPGTGKTYIGLIITRILLQNIKPWDCPILVVSHTNHALDQFLEGLLQFTNKIVRIGGQSKSEKLDYYNLKEFRRRYRRENDLRDCGNFFGILQNILTAIAYKEAVLEDTLQFNSLLLLNKLKYSMTPNQFEMFYEQNDFFIQWLTEEVDTQMDNLEFCPNTNEDILQFLKINGSSNYLNVNKCKILPKTKVEYEVDEEHFQRLKDAIDLNDFEGVIKYDNTDSYTCYLELELQFYKENLTKRLITDYQNDYNKFCYYEYDVLKSLHYKLLLHKYIKMKLKEICNIEVNSIDFNDDIYLLNYTERWRLYKYWVEEYIQLLREEIDEEVSRYEMFKPLYEALQQKEDLRYLRTMDIVGMTTTGAARLRPMLIKLKSKIVIVEEAAEVLEAHIVTSLTKDCEHVILIGDHEQLRPSTSVYKLAKHYNMDISLFERMLKNGMNCYKLGVQHRMRPEIASLIVPTIYKELENHVSVLNRPDIRGVSHNLFFLTHTNTEDEVPDSASRRNRHEAQFLIAFCCYLKLQGYEGSEITILTTYVGQMNAMLSERRKNPLLSDVRITVVDKYQGEENHIILLSLVRSNKLGNIGFLSTKNRVCVALSRARDGFFIIGNMSNLEEGSSVWHEIKSQLEKGNHIGPDLTLRCQVHPNQLTRVRNAEDFSKIPKGGCHLICDEILECGHRCDKQCHLLDREHTNYFCTKPCERQICLLDEHSCPKRCGAECGICVIKVKKDPPCGHSDFIPCAVDIADYKCEVEIETTLEACGHNIKKLCYVDIKDFNCPYDCEDRLPCGHQCTLKCHKMNDPDHLTYKCLKDCTNLNLNCNENHQCTKRCHEDCGECNFQVVKKLPCGHFHRLFCHLDVHHYKCDKPCELFLPCSHKCKKKCFEKCECDEIVSKILPSCKHIQKIACKEGTTLKKCLEPCERRLKCGHLCKRKCNEDCDERKCLKVISKPVQAPCGHKVNNYLCYMTNEDFKDDLCLFCDSPCQKNLDCGHTCQGDCGKCVAFSFEKIVFHAPCKEKCGRILVCGHKCEALCGEICPPCKKPCMYSCKHKSCSNKCGQPCSPCNNPCTNKCSHYTCRRKCSELCYIDECKKNCTKKLKCGHTCNQPCHENCPPCTDCQDVDHSKHSSIILDCGCDVNLFELKDQFKSSNCVGLVNCPSCLKPIIKTNTFKANVLQKFHNFAEIGRKVILQHCELSKKCKKLAKDIEKRDIKLMSQDVKNFKRLLTSRLRTTLQQRNKITKNYSAYVIAVIFSAVLENKYLHYFLPRLTRIFEQRLDFINHFDINHLKRLLSLNTTNNIHQEDTDLLRVNWIQCTCQSRPFYKTQVCHRCRTKI